MELQTKRLLLRNWMPADEKQLAELANNRKVWINLVDVFPHPYTQADAREWITRTAAEEPTLNFAITLERKPIGGIGLIKKTDIERNTARVGYWLGEPFWGQAYAGEALETVVDYAFGPLDLRRLEATVFEWNPNSARVLEKTGFELEGRMRKACTKDGKTIDLLLYARVR